MLDSGVGEGSRWRTSPDSPGVKFQPRKVWQLSEKFSFRDGGVAVIAPSRVKGRLWEGGSSENMSKGLLF